MLQRNVAEDQRAERPARVIPLRQRQRPHIVPLERPERREPWTPREMPALVSEPAPRVEAAPIPPPLVRQKTFFTTTHVTMLAVFVVVCVSMIVFMVGYRLVTSYGTQITPAALTERLAPPSSVAEPPRLVPTPTIQSKITVIQPNYEVVRGDTLASIAARHAVSVDVLAAMNNIQNRNALVVGQRLVIP
ncbi:MAG: LysM domain-containing protein [Chloroflexota bacterium]